jgi:Flp pilus assembly protein TadD
VLRAQGRLEDAAAFFARAASVPGSGWAIEYQEADVLFELRRFPEAESAIKLALAGKTTPSAIAVEALIDLGWRGDAALAIRHLAELPPLRRNDEEVAFLTAYAQILARQPDAALATLKAFPMPFFSTPYFFGPKAYWAGIAHQEANRAAEAKTDREEALAEIRTRLEKAPNNALLHQLEGLVLSQLGRLPEAQRDIRLSERRVQRPATAPAWTEDAALLYCASGRSVDAMDRIEHLLSGPSVWPLTSALLRLDPFWDSLRDKLRFQKLMHADGGGPVPLKPHVGNP